jgi:hypothetical protein
MPSPREIRAALCTLLLCACSSGPEVVATERALAGPPMSDAALFNLPPLVRGCRKGIYNGTFGTKSTGDAASGFQMDGYFTFELVDARSGGGGEFTKISDNAQLSGKSDAAQIRFTGIVNGSCSEGQFQSKIENGEFTVSDGALTPFAGTIDGTYDAKADLEGSGASFSGTWTISLGIGGLWTAIRAAKQ